MEGHEKVIIVLASVSDDAPNDGSVRVNIGGVIIEGRDCVQVRGGVHLGGGLVNDFDGSSGGRAGVLGIHGDNDDSVHASGTEIFHDAINVGLAILHADGYIILFTKETA